MGPWGKNWEWGNNAGRFKRGQMAHCVLKKSWGGRFYPTNVRGRKEEGKSAHKRRVEQRKQLGRRPLRRPTRG